jgi:hypothetical protein
MPLDVGGIGDRGRIASAMMNEDAEAAGRSFREEES